MIYKESRKSALWTILAAFILAGFGFYGYFLDYGNLYLVVGIVGILCMILCLKKATNKNFLKIEDDGFIIENSGKNMKFFYKDFENITFKTYDLGKNKHFQILNFIFKKSPQMSEDDKFRFLKFHSDKEASLPDIYETSIYEIGKNLREKAGFSSQNDDAKK